MSAQRPRHDAALWSIECPSCGGLVEAESRGDTMTLGAEHCREAHNYEVPPEHLEAAIRLG